MARASLILGISFVIAAVAGFFATQYAIPRYVPEVGKFYASSCTDIGQFDSEEDCRNTCVNEADTCFYKQTSSCWRVPNGVSCTGGGGGGGGSNCSNSEFSANIQGGDVTIHNNGGATCQVHATSWRVNDRFLPEFLDTQELNDSGVGNVGPHQDISFSLGIPDCSHQVDAGTGSPPSNAHYGGNYIDGRITFTDYLCDGTCIGQSCQATPTPTPATPTPTPATPTPTPVPPSAVLLGICDTPDVTRVNLNWTVNGTQALNVAERQDNGGAFAAIFQEQGPPFNRTSYPDTQIVFGHTYVYRLQVAPGVYSNTITIAASAATCNAATPTPTGTPTPTPATPTPTPATPTPAPSTNALVCAPINQTAAINQSVSLQASGGSGAYGWSAPGSTSLNQSGSSVSVRYASSGTYNVLVQDSSGLTATCSIVIVGPTATPPPTFTPPPTTPALSIQKTVRNVTQNGGEAESVPVTPSGTVEFIIRVSSVGTGPALDVIVRDTLPSGLTYQLGTTTVDAVPAPDGIVGVGISLGTMNPGRTSIVRFRAAVASASFFPVGTTTLVNTAYARASNTFEVSDVAQVMVTIGSTVSQVPTGPAESAVLALIVSTIITLLYVGYTSTDMFRMREATGLARTAKKDKSLGDFKG